MVPYDVLLTATALDIIILVVRIGAILKHAHSKLQHAIPQFQCPDDDKNSYAHTAAFKFCTSSSNHHHPE